MKVMTARDAKNHFGEFLDTARREPVVVTKNDRPVGIMISVEDAADAVTAAQRLCRPPVKTDWRQEQVGDGLVVTLRVERSTENLRKGYE